MRKEEIAKLVKAHLENTGESAYNFSKRAKLDHATIQKIGKHNPNTRTREQIALALGLKRNSFTKYKMES